VSVRNEVTLLRKSGEMGIVGYIKMSGCSGNFGKWLVTLRKDVRLLRKRVDMTKVRVRVEFRLLGKRLQ